TGPSGAGKTTLLRLLFAADDPSSGQIIVGGRNVNRISAGAVPYLRRNIGVVFQDFKLLANRTALENVGFALEVLGASDAQIRERAEKRLGQVGLTHKAKSLPARLSGGEQQRIAIARALVNEPAIVLGAALAFGVQGARSVLSSWGAQPSVTVYLDRHMPESQARALADRVREQESQVDVAYVSPAQAMDRLRVQLGDLSGALDGLSSN